jgi:hypothetical protein
MHVTLGAVLFGTFLFGVIVLAQEIGRRVGLRRRARRGDEDSPLGLEAIDTAVFGLMGLMIAFTFYGAANRFDKRREYVVLEANDIGTVWLRLDLLPPAAQPKLRGLVRRYVDARIAAYDLLPDMAAARNELTRAIALQGQIWSAAVEASRDSSQATLLLLPALNDMFDIAATRTVALDLHAPTPVFLMLGFLVLACAVLAGHGMVAAGRRRWLHELGFAAVLTFAVFVIFDYEFPRTGLIRLDTADQLLVDVRNGMR